MLNVWEGWTAVSTQQTSDCNLTLILNVSIINPLPDGRLCGNTWLICFSFYPQFFLYTSKTTTVIWDSKHPCPVSSYSTWNPLHRDSCYHSLGGRSKMRGTKSWIFNSKALTKIENQASKWASPALISELTMHRFPLSSLQLQENSHYESHSSSPWPAAATVMHVQGASSAHAQWDHLQWSSCPGEGLGHRPTRLRQPLSVVRHALLPVWLTPQLQ